MSRLTSREVVLQPEVRGTAFSLELDEAERLLLAQFVYCLCYIGSPIHEVLKPLYLRPGYNRAELSVDRELRPSVFGGVYGTNEATDQRQLTSLRTKLTDAERLLEGRRQRIEDLIAQNDVLRAEVSKQGEALSRFQMEAPTSEPGNPPDDHVEAPRKWKVQVSWRGGRDAVWISYGDGDNGHKLGSTRSEGYRFKRSREADLGSDSGFAWRVVPLGTPDGVEPDRGYYTVEIFLAGEWIPTSCNRADAQEEGTTLAPGKDTLDGHRTPLKWDTVEQALAHKNKHWRTSPNQFRVKWHSNNA